MWEAIQKRSHEPIYKTYTKIEAKGLRAILYKWRILTYPISPFKGLLHSRGEPGDNEFSLDTYCVFNDRSDRVGYAICALDS